MTTSRFVTIAAVALLAATLGKAQTAPAQQATAAPPRPPLIHTQIDLGYVSTAGNSRVRTLNAAEQVVVRPGSWTFTQAFAVVNGSTSGVETANNLKAGLRADYTVGSGFRVYALGTFYRNRFAGIARRFEEAVGLAYGVLKGPTHVFDVEGGAGRIQQTASDGTTQQNWTSRVATRYRFSFATSAYAEQKVELISDLQGLRNELLTSESALTAPLSGNIALKLGYTVRFASQPRPTFKSTDTVLSVGLQLQF